jgi:DNA-binding transcriptional LysR family regulator
LLPCFLADQDPRLVRLPPGVPFKNELWLLVHGELRHAPRVRAVIEWLDDVLECASRRLRGVAGSEE